jgi:serine/threonine-protein kinase
MNVTEPFVLKDDILLIPCAELGEDFRRRISFDDGDFTLSHRHGRAFAQVIDGGTAALLQLFRNPRTIANAVIENSRVLGRDPKARFEELLPHLGTFVQDGVLVPAGEDTREIRPRYDSGAAIAGWEIVRCVRFMDDSEIYEVRKGGEAAAVKIARTATPAVESLFRNEAAILRHLDGSGVAPRLIDAGRHETQPYLAIEWIGGDDALAAAARRRHDRGALIELCASIAAAYAALHARGVLHGDIHPRNVLVGEKIVLLDFGYARRTDRRPRTGRGGVAPFLEPESIAGEVPSSEAGEQYALGALLYLLIAGHPYLEFRLDRDEMLRQVENDPPLPFAERGVAPWPEVERILFRALEKDPARRHASIAGMAALLAEVRE